MRLLTAKNSHREARVLGARESANDEPEPGDLSEGDLLAIDRAHANVKAADPFRQADADAVGARELHLMRCAGLL